MYQTFTYSPLDRVYYDGKTKDILPKELELMDIDRLFIVSSSTISKKTDEIDKIRDILGKKFVGIFDSCEEHSPLENVVECAKKIKSTRPDMILTVGGGTPIDTVKVSQLCLTLGIFSSAELKKISGKKFFPPNPSMNISKLRKILKK